MIEKENAIQTLENKTIKSVKIRRGAVNEIESHIDGDPEDAILFETSAGGMYLLTYKPDCWEGVYIEDICGDIKDLAGEKILLAREVSGRIINEDNDSGIDERVGWTFYNIATMNNAITIRFKGEDNGYYGVNAEFYIIKKESK